jgi:hypothetical protein
MITIIKRPEERLNKVYETLVSLIVQPQAQKS